MQWERVRFCSEAMIAGWVWCWKDMNGLGTLRRWVRVGFDAKKIGTGWVWGSEDGNGLGLMPRRWKRVGFDAEKMRAVWIFFCKDEKGWVWCWNENRDLIFWFLLWRWPTGLQHFLQEIKLDPRLALVLGDSQVIRQVVVTH